MQVNFCHHVMLCCMAQCSPFLFKMWLDLQQTYNNGWWWMVVVVVGNSNSEWPPLPASSIG